jgi:hypothetical protein
MQMISHGSHFNRTRAACLLRRSVLVLTFLAAALAGPTARTQDTDRRQWANEMTPRSGRNTPPGRWLPGRTETSQGGELTEEQKREIERLESIGYLAGHYEATGTSGVTIHDAERAWEGYNFYTSGHFPGAVLMDMSGNVLHEWRCSFLTAFPDAGELIDPDRSNRWRYAHLYENGDVLGIYEGLGLVKLDKDSNIIWAHKGGEHHDLKVADDGRIYVLSREAHMVRWLNQRDPVLEDYITILSPDGELLRRVSLLTALSDSHFSNLMKCSRMQKSGDIFHTNAVEILDGSMADRIPAFKEGNILTSFRRMDTIAVVDMDLEKVVWTRFGLWLAQHDPTPLANGDIMVFDNRGLDDRSRVVEFDPATVAPVWIYEGDSEHPFYTGAGGANQRLPNGNTLITETDYGRAFEVTRDGEIVWEYTNPARAGKSNELIASIFEMIRLPLDFQLGWLTSE